MFGLTLENSKGQQLTITQNEAKFQIEEVTGLNPPTASISLSENIGDGDEFVHERTGSRNLVINMYIKGNVEANRLELYKYVRNGKFIKVYIKTRTKNVWINGRVENIDINNFSQLTSCQISIICPDPWFKDIMETINTINTVQPKFHFPFAIVKPIPFSTFEQIQILNLINEGNVESGCTISITARGTIINPIIYNRETKEYIGLGTTEKPYEMQTGDEIIITTHTNNKKVKLIRNAVETNIFNYLKPGSTFLKINAGDNIFTYAADDGNEYIDIVFKHYSNYEGI